MTSKYTSSSIRSVSNRLRSDPTLPQPNNMIPGVTVTQVSKVPVDIKAIINYPIYTKGTYWKDITEEIRLSVINEDGKQVERTATFLVNQAQSEYIPQVEKGEIFEPGSGIIPITAREQSCRNAQLFNKTLEYSNWRVHNVSFSWSPAQQNEAGTIYLIGDSQHRVSKKPDPGNMKTQGGYISFAVASVNATDKIGMNQASMGGDMMTCNDKQDFDRTSDLGYFQWCLERPVRVDKSVDEDHECLKLGVLTIYVNATFIGYTPLPEFKMIPEWAAEGYPLSGSDIVKITAARVVNSVSTQDDNPYTDEDVESSSIPVMLMMKKELAKRRNEPKDTVVDYYVPRVVELALKLKDFSDDVEHERLRLGNIADSTPIPSSSIKDVRAVRDYIKGESFVTITQESVDGSKTVYPRIADHLLQIDTTNHQALNNGLIFTHQQAVSAAFIPNQYQKVIGADIGVCTPDDNQSLEDEHINSLKSGKSAAATSLFNAPVRGENNWGMALLKFGVTSMVTGDMKAGLVAAVTIELEGSVPIYTCGAPVPSSVVSTPKQDLRLYGDQLGGLAKNIFGKYKWVGKYGVSPSNSDDAKDVITCDVSSRDQYAFQVFTEGSADINTSSQCTVISTTVFLANSYPFDGSENWYNTATPLNNYMGDLKTSTFNGVVAKGGRMPVITTQSSNFIDDREVISTPNSQLGSYSTFLIEADSIGTKQFLWPAEINGVSLSKIDRVYFAALKGTLMHTLLPVHTQVSRVFITKDNKNYRPRKIKDDNTILFSSPYAEKKRACFMASFNRKYDFTFEDPSKSVDIPVVNNVIEKKKKSNQRMVNLARPVIYEESDEE